MPAPTGPIIHLCLYIIIHCFIDSDISSEHDDLTMSKISEDVTKQLGTAAISTRVVPHRINPSRSSGTVSPVTPHEEDPSSTKIQLDDSSPESDIDVESQPPPASIKKKKDALTLELSSRGSDSGSEKKSSKKQKSSTTPPSSRIVT